MKVILVESPPQEAALRSEIERLYWAGALSESARGTLMAAQRRLLLRVLHAINPYSPQPGASAADFTRLIRHVTARA